MTVGIGVCPLRVSVVDKLEIGDTATVGDGYLAVNAKIARLGLYQYTRAEIGDTDGQPNELVSVYRPEAEVFDTDAMASFAHKPITLNHPRDAVSKDNWRKHTRGMSGGRVARVGDFLEIPMVVNDAEAIAAIDGGTRQLSAGYSANITIGDGLTPEGEPYRAVMSDIRGNHIAIVARGRAGSQCRIGDAAWPVEDNTPPKKETRNVKTILVDSVPFNQDNLDGLEAAVKKVEDRAANAETKLADANKALTDAEVKAAADLKDATIRAETAEAKIVSLEKELADSKVTPEQFRDAAKVYAGLIDAAAKIAPEFKVEDNMSEADIRKGVVLAKFGDAYATKGDAFFDALFEVESAKLADTKVETDPYRAAMAARDSAVVADVRTAAVSARQEMIDRMINPVAADAK